MSAWTAAEIAAVQADAIAERARRGPVAAPAAAVGNLAAAAVAAPRPDCVAPGAGEVASGAVRSVRFGEMLQGMVGPAVLGSKTDGQTIFCERVNGHDAEKFNSKPSLCDAVILPAKLNATPSVPCQKWCQRCRRSPWAGP